MFSVKVDATVPSGSGGTAIADTPKRICPGCIHAMSEGFVYRRKRLPKGGEVFCPLPDLPKPFRAERRDKFRFQEAFERFSRGASEGVHFVGKREPFNGFKQIWQLPETVVA